MSPSLTSPESHLSALVTSRRRSRGLSQRELAARAGLGRATICRIEGGRRPAPSTLRSLTAELGLTYEELQEAVARDADRPARGRAGGMRTERWWCCCGRHEGPQTD